jgi:hypothetical protein
VSSERRYRLYVYLNDEYVPIAGEPLFDTLQDTFPRLDELGARDRAAGVEWMPGRYMVKGVLEERA